MGIDWRPIETAPLDGSTVLLYRFVDPWHVVGYGFWQPALPGDAFGIEGWITYGLMDPPGNLGLGLPSHWAPIDTPGRRDA